MPVLTKWTLASQNIDFSYVKTAKQDYVLFSLLVQIFTISLTEAIYKMQMFCCYHLEIVIDYLEHVSVGHSSGTQLA